MAPSQDLARGLWQQLNAVMLTHMAGISLSSLVQEQLDRGVKVEARPTRRPPAPLRVVQTVRRPVPNSVFAFGRSFAA